MTPLTIYFSRLRFKVGCVVRSDIRVHVLTCENCCSRRPFVKYLAEEKPFAPRFYSRGLNNAPSCENLTVTCFTGHLLSLLILRHSETCEGACVRLSFKFCLILARRALLNELTYFLPNHSKHPFSIQSFLLCGPCLSKEEAVNWLFFFFTPTFLNATCSCDLGKSSRFAPSSQHPAADEGIYLTRG